MQCYGVTDKKKTLLESGLAREDLHFRYYHNNSQALGDFNIPNSMLGLKNKWMRLSFAMRTVHWGSESLRNLFKII